MAEADSHGVPPSVARFAQRLSPRARAAFSRLEWTWRPEWRTSRQELREDLARHHIPEWPFLWPLEEAFGGVEVRLAGWDLRFGIWAGSAVLQQAKLGQEQGEARFVVLADWGNGSLLSDETGQVYLLRESGALSLSDRSFECFLEHHAMSLTFDDWSKTTFEAFVMPKAAIRALAEELRVPVVVEATDECHRWWRDDLFTLLEWGEQDPRGVVWSKTLQGLVRALDETARLDPDLCVKPLPSYADEHKEILTAEEIRARAPDESALSTRPSARRIELLGEPPLFTGEPPSTGDVWLSGEGEGQRIDVLERRAGEVVNYWEVTPRGTHALLRSSYGR
jgi:hypothetical protein